jgi:tetratricopeptide (TPR) repeat protein
MGLVWAALMDSRLAIHYFSDAVAIAREIGDRQAEESHLGSLGVIWAEEGMFRMVRAHDEKETIDSYFHKAIYYYEQALAIAREIGDRRGEGSQLGNLGNAWSYLGEGSRAIDYLQQALDILRESGDRRNEGFHLANLGSIYKSLGNVEKARIFLQKALEVYNSYGDPRAVTIRTLLNKDNELSQMQTTQEDH